MVDISNLSSSNTVSTLIPEQFPDNFRNQNPDFVAFVKAYYEWMELNSNPVGYNRRLLNDRDIDDTLDQYITYFKNEYLPDIQFNTASNPKLFIKHSLDFYRSKGTPRSIDLFFRLIYGVNASVNKPSDRIFQLSAGTWNRPVYLEVSHKEDNVNYVGKQISGSVTGTTAFVEKLVRRQVGSQYIDIFYISNLSDHFQTGETITYSHTPKPFSSLPIVIGSLTELELINGSTGFSKGEVVTIDYPNADGGKAVVNSVSSSSGLLDIKLKDGGWGYSLDSNVIFSETVLQLNSINTPDPIEKSFVLFETLYQPLVNINYKNLTGPIDTNVSISVFNGANVKATGTILSLDSSSNAFLVCPQFLSNGALSVFANNDNFVIDLLNTTVNGTINTVVDMTATANVMGMSDNVSIEFANTIGNFVIGETITQNTGGGIIQTITNAGQNNIITVANCYGHFESNAYLTGFTSLAVGYTDSISSSIGIINTTSGFTSYPGNYIYGALSNTFAVVSGVSEGSLGGAEISALSYIEYINLNIDKLNAKNVANVYFTDIKLDGTNSNVALNGYGFPKNPTLGTNAILYDALSYLETAVGQITSLKNINPGRDYTVNPFVIAYNPDIYGLDLRDYQIQVANSTGVYRTKELITQSTIQPNTTTIEVLNPNNFNNGDAIKQGSTYGVIQTVNNNLFVVNSVSGTFLNNQQILKVSDNTNTTITNINSNNYITLAKGLLKSANGNILNIQRLSFADFIADPTAPLVGAVSNVYSYAVSVIPDRVSLPDGINANIMANTSNGSGTVETLRLLDSGFGYVNNQVITFSSLDGSRSGTALTYTGKEGHSEGFYTDTRGQLSSTSNYLPDNYYYQVYSYEIVSKIPFDVYKTMFKQVCHPAGMVMFGAFSSECLLKTDFNCSSEISISKT